ncbi:MAG: efflux RND transporter periplasmic adaptor subunit [Candidatus Falkowbacteria bacterium]|nr:efflux RND transporter periplasmic adaptor subunit [Candidatus Falkowbacteria bacterium]
MAQSILEESKKAKQGIFGFIFQKKFLIIAATVLVVAGASYYFFGQGGKQSAVAVQQKQTTVKKEDLKISVESSGKVVAKDGVELSFPVSGNLEVSNVYVKEGDKVKKGDKIAAVKTESLEFELRSAYSNYQSALSSFNTKAAAATASEISKSKATVDQAQVSLDQAKISLEQTKSSTAQSIANAELNVQTATNNLKINTDINDSEIVRNAYTSLISTIKSINISLQKILRDSDSILGVDDTMINSDFKSVLGAKDSTAYGTAKSSYSAVKQARDELDAIANSLSSSDTAAVDQAAVKANATLIVFQDHLYDMQVLLEATIPFIGLSQTKLDGFKSTVSSNRTSINSTIASLDSSVQSVSNAKSNLNQYQLAYNKAVNDLATTKSQAEQSINNANISIRSKEIALSQAKNDYNDLIAPASESDLASARSQLTSAAISVDKAKYNMEQATLTSPIDGVIAMLNYKTGDIILSDSAKTMASIINNDTLFIEANIEEADISKLKVGEKAQVTFDAVDGVNLTGEISFISLTSETSANSIVTYLVRVILSNTGATQIREGMTATIEFVTAEAPGVLAVPVAAVHNIGGKPAVEKVDGTIANVTTGFTDGKKVEVISGLNEGDVVIY